MLKSDGCACGCPSGHVLDRNCEKNLANRDCIPLILDMENLTRGCDQVRDLLDL